MSLEARGLNDVDDRITLVAAMNEISRLGRDNLTRTNEAHREVTEQVLISAVTSAEALSRIIQRSQMSSSERHANASRESADNSSSARSHRRHEGAASVLQNDMDSEQLEEHFIMNLTAQERLLIERYRAQKVAECIGVSKSTGRPVLSRRSKSLPKERPIASKLERVVEEACEWVSEPEVGEFGELSRKNERSQSLPHGIPVQIMLEGGSKIEQFQPPKPSSTKAKIVELLHSLPGSPPSNKNAKMWDSQSHSPGSAGALKAQWSNTKVLSGLGREADQTLTEYNSSAQRGVVMPHASLFGTLRHLRNPEEERHVEHAREVAPPQRELYVPA